MNDSDLYFFYLYSFFHLFIVICSDDTDKMRNMLNMDIYPTISNNM